MMKQPELGLKISELRQNLGLTQDELVKQCKLSIRTLQRIESGEVIPRAYTLRLIAKALDFDFLKGAHTDSEIRLKQDNASRSENTSNLDKTRNLLIKRYASLNSSTVVKIEHKLKTHTVEEISEKHERMLYLSIALVILVGVALLVQFIVLYSTTTVTSKLITNVMLNVLVLVFFMKGLHDNFEIKNILKTLKEMG